MIGLFKDHFKNVCCNHIQKLPTCVELFFTLHVEIMYNLIIQTSAFLTNSEKKYISTFPLLFHLWILQNLVIATLSWREKLEKESSDSCHQPSTIRWHPVTFLQVICYEIDIIFLQLHEQKCDKSSICTFSTLNCVSNIVTDKMIYLMTIICHILVYWRNNASI